MATLTQMEKTTTGWRCPRCGSTLEDGLLNTASASCNCYGPDALHEHLRTSGTNPGGPGLKGLTLLGPDGEEVP
jgi:hypothetical protein